MQTLTLIQGSPEWAAARAQHFCASDAPAVMGASKYKTRNALLREKATGLAEEVNDATQRLFDSGHRTEASARPIVEELIGDDLSPVTALSDCGTYLASLDGITLMGDTIFEHKLWSEPLAAQARSGNLDAHYIWQMEHQLMVTGAEKVVFVCSDGTREKFASMEYRAVPGRREQLIAGWRQFAEDLKNYVAGEAVQAAPAGRAPEQLPALRIEVTGMVTASNLDAFKEHALAVFKGINRNLTTDTDFADAEKTVKWCADVEDRLKAAKQHALSQTESIDALFRAIDDISGEARTVRLELDRLVKAEKERRRGEIVAGGITKLRAHLAELDAKIGRKGLMPDIPADFGGAIKGKKSLQSMEDAVDHELARAKISANEIAMRIMANLAQLAAHQEHAHLWPDVAAIVQKQPEDLQALIDSRIAAHRADQQRRLEAERARIRAEEQARADREAQERLALELRQRDEAAALERREREAQEAASRPAVQAAPALAAVAPTQPAANTPAVVPLRPDPGKLVTLGAIKEALAPLSIDAAGLASWGFHPAATEKSAKLFRSADVPMIFEYAASHLRTRQAKWLEAA